jgi:hypothetical protein
MAFDTLNTGLKHLAEQALAFCKSHYGANGLRIAEGIADEIAWRPTFFLRPDKFNVLAIEVDDKLYPEALKGAAYDVVNYAEAPISVYQVCSLSTYQSDSKQTRINLMRRHGFGIITVDDDGKVTIQHTCVALAQHISNEQLDAELAGVTPNLKVKFKQAHVTYIANEGQGLQQAGQIVEALINSIADQAAKKGVITAAEAKGKLADVIDALYEKKTFKEHRAALGAARDFVKEFRNIASHAPKNANEAAQKIKKCKTGFLDAISVATKLRTMMQKLGYKAQTYTT